MSKKVINILIILLIISIIGILITIKYLQSNPYITLEKNGEAGEKIDYEKQEIQKVTDFGKFYTVVNCVNTYIDKINIKNSSYYGRDENNNYTIVVSDEDINNNIYELLSKEYINNNGITLENLRSKIDISEEKQVFVPLKMNVVLNTIVEKYAVYGFLTDIESNFSKEIYLYVNLDITNKNFSIEPIEDKEIKSIDEIKIVNSNNTIEKNDNNTAISAKISEEYLCKKYMFYYKKILIASPKLAYKYLDNDYKEKRFGTYEEFKQYIQDNKDKINEINLKEYLVEYYEGYSEYVCKDKYENLYIFDEKGIMDYTLKLDTYTIATEKFKETYNNTENYKKVQMNIDKFFQMINRQDYKTAYSCLAQSYKNNYFKTEDEFVKFAKSNFFTYNKVTYLGYEQKGSKLYTFNIRLSDKTEENTDTKDIKIIMQLNENLDFEMSFSME